MIMVHLSMHVLKAVGTDNEAQGQSARLINANGVILCPNLHERLRDFQYLPKDEKSLVEILM